MQCSIYKSNKKQYIYLYLAAKDDFSHIPEALLKLLGEPVHVMDLDLHPERRLAQEDVVEVLRNLEEQGWHLQMPQREEGLRIEVRH
ncbi:MAG: YcgL domain-containing protein [Candidatus Competibacteraceae bacterium]|nr:YcgL domain-containing protein [Candidatus Competibacteraceae bacterium]MCB1822061.1 YcgL domain-containing protein [Candidatus Competibacteraceae bacterium]